MPENFISAMGFGNCGVYVDGCRLASGSGLQVANEPTQALIDSYYWTFDDGAAIGTDAFFIDATSNLTNFVWKIKAMNSAMRKYNLDHPTAKKCIAVMYEQEDAAAPNNNALAMFDAADVGGADSPMCSIGGLPLIGVWGNGKCINPMKNLPGRGPFAMMGTVYNITGSIAPKTCVDTWKAAGAQRVMSYMWTSGDFNAIATASATLTTKNAIIATGAEPVLGIGSARAENCGDPTVCSGSKSSSYNLHDPNGFGATTQSFIRATDDPKFGKIMYTMNSPGDYGENSSMEGAIICDAHDNVDHRSVIGGISQGFDCPNVPDYLRGTVPSGGNYVSYDANQWTRRGHWRLAQTLSKWWRTGVKPTGEGWVAWTYRQHPYALTGSGLQICPTAATTLHNGSMLHQFWGDNIDVTAMGSGIKLRVKMGSTTLYNGTLTNDLATNIGPRQISIPIGSARGRPTFEILDANNNVVQSAQGDVEYTSTPMQKSGKTGRNLSHYSNFMTLSGPAKASLTSVTGSMAEGNVGTSASTFRITLDAAAQTARTFHWAVTSLEADAQDFFYIDPLTTQRAMPQGDVTIPIGGSSVDFDVQVNGDVTPETDENYTVTISGSPPIAVATAAGTIRNDDALLPPNVSVTGPDTVAPGSVANIVIHRQGDLSRGENVSWAVSPYGTTGAREDDFPAILDDTFGGTSLDDTKWCVSSGRAGNQSSCPNLTVPSSPDGDDTFQTWDPDLVTVSGGSVHLGMAESTGVWTAGQIFSKDVFFGGMLKYSITMPAGKGSHYEVARYPEDFYYGPGSRSGVIRDLIWLGKTSGLRDKTWRSELGYSGATPDEEPKISEQITQATTWADALHVGQTVWKTDPIRFGFSVDGNTFAQPSSWPNTPAWRQDTEDDDGNPISIDWPGGGKGSPFDRPFRIAFQSGVGTSTSEACTGETSCPDATALSGSGVTLDDVRYYQYPRGTITLRPGQDSITIPVYTADAGVAGARVFAFSIVSADISTIIGNPKNVSIVAGGEAGVSHGKETYFLDFGKNAGGFTDNRGIAWENGRSWITGATELNDNSSGGAATWETDLEEPPSMEVGNTITFNGCPEDVGWPFNAPGKDVHVILPNDRVCTPNKNAEGKLLTYIQGTTSNPVHNVWIEGGSITNKWGQGSLTGDKGAGLLDFRNWSGTVFIEGVYLNPACTCEDVIKTNQPNSEDARVVVQNSWFGPSGHCGAGGTHGDEFHAQGTGGFHHELEMTNIYADELAQGVFVPPRPNVGGVNNAPAGHGVSLLKLSHYYSRRYTACKNPSGGGIGWRAMWLEVGASRPTPQKGVFFDQVYFPGAPDLQYFSYPPVTGWDAQGCAVYPASAGVTSGKICQGDPPNGSFIPVDKVGLGYDRSFFTAGGTGTPVEIINAAEPRVDLSRVVGSTMQIAIPVDTSRGRSRSMTLGFSARDETAAGQRVFDISGNYVRNGFDIFAAAGGRDTETVIRAPVTIGEDGYLRLTLTGVTGDAQLNWLTLTRPTVGVVLDKSEYEEGDKVTMTFTRSTPDEPVTMGWAVRGVGETPVTGKDFVGGLLPSGLVSIPFGRSTTTASITLLDDGIQESAEGFQVSETGGTGADISLTAPVASAVVAASEGSVVKPTCTAPPIDPPGTLTKTIRVGSKQQNVPIMKGALVFGVPGGGVLRHLDTTCTMANVCISNGLSCGDPKRLQADTTETKKAHILRITTLGRFDELLPGQQRVDNFRYDVCDKQGQNCTRVRVDLIVTGEE